MHSTAVAAIALNLSQRTVQKLCAAHAIGTRIGRTIVLSDGDIERLRQIERPAPTFCDPAAARKAVASRRDRKNTAKNSGK